MCDPIYSNFNASSVFCDSLDAECFYFSNCDKCPYGIVLSNDDDKERSRGNEH